MGRATANGTLAHWPDHRLKIKDGLWVSKNEGRENYFPPAQWGHAVSSDNNNFTVLHKIYSNICYYQTLLHVLLLYDVGLLLGMECLIVLSSFFLFKKNKDKKWMSSCALLCFIFYIPLRLNMTLEVTEDTDLGTQSAASTLKIEWLREWTHWSRSWPPEPKLTRAACQDL